MDNNFRNKLIPLLTLMKSKAEDKGLSPSLRTNTVIDMLKSTGVTLGYAQLKQMLEDPSVKDLVKSVDKDRIELVGSDDDPDGDLDLSGMDDLDGVENQPIDQSQDMSQQFGNGSDMEMNTGGPDMSQPAHQPDPNLDPNASNIPAGPSKEQQIATMAKRALGRR